MGGNEGVIPVGRKLAGKVSKMAKHTGKDGRKGAKDKG